MSDVKKEVLKAGTGPNLQKGQNVTVHCDAKLELNGHQFWSTRDQGQKPFTFRVGMGQVITGWDEGCMTMRVGEKARLTIPSYKGYGDRGFPAWGIPANANLIFEIEVLSAQ